jgi:Holliday junction resolvase RusA-like endonuclease
MLHTFELNIEPVSWLAPIRARNIFYNPRDKEKQVTSNLLMQQWHEPPISDYVKLNFTFVHAFPKSMSKKNRALAMQGQLFPTRKDLSNCVKFYEDCLKKIIIEDDRIVVEIIAKKLYGEKGKIIIGVEPCELLPKK